MWDSDHDFVSTASIEWALPAGGSVRIISVDRVHGNLIPGARETIDGNNLYVKIGNTIGVFYLGLPENSYVFSVGDEWQNYPCDSIYIRIVSDDTSPVEATKYPSDQNVRSFQK